MDIADASGRWRDIFYFSRIVGIKKTKKVGQNLQGSEAKPSRK
jgi:hypothetical protein